MHGKFWENAQLTPKSPCLLVGQTFLSAWQTRMSAPPDGAAYAASAVFWLNRAFSAFFVGEWGNVGKFLWHCRNKFATIK
jgi:hypothetical protein